MSQLFETIKIINGTPQLLNYHNQRCNNSRKELYGLHDPIDLNDYISTPAYLAEGQVKCRISYSEGVNEVVYQHYKTRTISSIKKVVDNTISYKHKYEDRTSLKNLYALRGDHDEVLIIRDGCVTDCFYYNVAFYDGDKWYTPKERLLQGVMRSYLLEKKEIHLRDIREKDISTYRSICLFNALTSFGIITLDTSTIC